MIQAFITHSAVPFRFMYIIPYIEPESHQGTLGTKVRTLQYFGEKKPKNQMTPMSKHFVIVGRRNSLFNRKKQVQGGAAIDG